MEEKIKVNSVEDIERVLYKQVELLAENSKECEPSELVKMTECIVNVYSILNVDQFCQEYKKLVQ